MQAIGLFFFSLISCAFAQEIIVTASCSGGLGNHLFPIATAYAYALDIGAEAIFPHTGMKSPVLSKVKFFSGEMPPLPVLCEQDFHYTELPKDCPRSVCLAGFFQSAHYFHHRRKEIVELFAAPAEISEKLAQNYKELLDQETVAIHIRRGDYLTYRKENGGTVMYILCEDSEFYEKALQYFDAEQNYFLIFSDDIPFAKTMSLFHHLKHVIYVEEQPVHEDFYLMSMCKHHILANSTFSWWAAYLCEYPEQKVIFPWKWFGPGVAKEADPQGIGGNFCSAPHYTPMNHWIKIE